MKTKKKKQNKKIIEDISQAEAGLLRKTMLIGVEGSKNLCEAQINTLTKSCKSKRKTALIASTITSYSIQPRQSATSMCVWVPGLIQLPPKLRL